MKTLLKDQNVIIIKALSVTKSVDALPEGVIRFIASTESEDRDGDVIKQSGLVLDHYRKNPVFLWAHNPKLPPIGKGIRSEVKGSHFELDVEFDLDDEFAKSIYNKYKKGHMNAVSIGFMPIELREREKGGFSFDAAEVYEVSAVPIGSNREALAVARSFTGESTYKSFATYYKGIADDAPAPVEPMTDKDSEFEEMFDLFGHKEFEDYAVLRKADFDKIMLFLTENAKGYTVNQRKKAVDVTEEGDESVKMTATGAHCVKLLGDIESEVKTPDAPVSIANITEFNDEFAQKVADLVASKMKDLEADAKQANDGEPEKKFAKVKIVSGISDN